MLRFRIRLRGCVSLSACHATTPQAGVGSRIVPAWHVDVNVLLCACDVTEKFIQRNTKATSTHNRSPHDRTGIEARRTKSKKIGGRPGASARGRRMATSVTAPTCEGFVRKSHGSRPFSSRHVTRYLVAAHPDCPRDPISVCPRVCRLS